jgi:hypothetical protein
LRFKLQPSLLSRLKLRIKIAGTVTFLDGGSPIGTGTLSGGIATFTTSALAVGNHTITTSYGGDENFNGSTGSLTGNPQVVNTSSPNPSVSGQSVTFTATISPVAPGGGTPTGTRRWIEARLPPAWATAVFRPARSWGPRSGPAAPVERLRKLRLELEKL